MDEILTHALTVHQPYAWALAAGHKPVENRTWRPPLGMVGKLIGIHAGLARDESADAAVLSALGWAELPDDLPRGALIGVARLVGVVRQTPWVHGEPDGHPTRAHVYTLMQGKSVGIELPKVTALRIEPWWRGPWGWLMGEAVLLPEPIPMRGQQGLWRLPEVVVREHRTWLNPTARALEQWRKAREVVR